MDEYEPVLIERCIKNRYDFLEEYERDRIYAITKKLAKDSEGEEFPGYEKRRSAVRAAVEKYLITNNTIVPGGFVDFRLREVYYNVEAMVAAGADAFFKEREFEEFTYLLSVFISEKESREEVLHILWEKGKIRLINKRGRDVTVKYEKEFYPAAYKKGLGEEDLAISAVISAAPGRLVFHSPPPSSPLKETLEKIFEGRCKVCTGCSICKNS